MNIKSPGIPRTRPLFTNLHFHFGLQEHVVWFNSYFTWSPGQLLPQHLHLLRLKKTLKPLIFAPYLSQSPSTSHQAFHDNMQDLTLVHLWCYFCSVQDSEECYMPFTRDVNPSHVHASSPLPSPVVHTSQPPSAVWRSTITPSLNAPRVEMEAYISAWQEILLLAH